MTEHAIDLGYGVWLASDSILMVLEAPPDSGRSNLLKDIRELKRDGTVLLDLSFHKGRRSVIALKDGTFLFSAVKWDILVERWTGAAPDPESGRRALTAHLRGKGYDGREQPENRSGVATQPEHRGAGRASRGAAQSG